MRTAKAGILMLFLVACSRADTYLRQPSIDILHYEISIELTDTSDSIAGITKIHVLMRDASVTSMWLDFAEMKVDELRVSGVERPFSYHNGKLSFDFDRPYSRGETMVVEVQYHGKPENGGMLIGKNKYGRRVFFADNWPDRAHHWFPSIDHPSDKATVDVSVTAPEKYEVVSNGRKIKTMSLPHQRKLTQWSERKAIPTYCITIGVAEFSIAHQTETTGIPIDWYAYPQDSEAAAQKFNRTGLALRYFSNLIGAYPYEKLAQVESTTQMGGMENASAIFYGESSFQGVPVSDYPVPHEIAHQWFGDSITEADWDHLWLSEGFATYFEALFYEYLQGPKSLKQSMARYEKKVFSYEPARSRPIVDPELTDLMKKLNSLNYEKGAWVLHMLRGILGERDFFRGIRSYFSAYEGQNVLTEDFQKVMESVSGIALSTFFRQWLYQPGWPEYRVLWHWDATAREVEIKIRQQQKTGLFDMPLEIVFSAENHQEKHRFRVADEEHTFRIPLSIPPSSIKIDPDGWLLKSVSVIPY